MAKAVAEMEGKAQAAEMTAKDTAGVSSMHLIADFISPRNMIEDAEEIEQLLYDAARSAKNTPLKTAIHKFPVQGVTGVILLAESHISIHTWPEHDYVSVDIFTCGKTTKPYNALEYLKKKFLPREIKVKEIKRGTL